jgi:hypothetical protein
MGTWTSRRYNYRDVEEKRDQLPAAQFCSGFIITIMKDFIKNLPRVMEFRDLHTAESLRAARETLNAVAGVYAIVCTVTNAVYIGSSINLAVRIADHIKNSSNVRLNRAIAKYGLQSFVVIVVERYELNPDMSLGLHKVNLLGREQYYLDLLFKLPKKWGPL